MNLKCAEILESSSEFSLEIITDYSGRNMHGKETAAVSGTMNDLFKAIANIIDIYDTYDQQILVEQLNQGLRSDSMGKTIVWY